MRNRQRASARQGLASGLGADEAPNDQAARSGEPGQGRAQSGRQEGRPRRGQGDEPARPEDAAGAGTGRGAARGRAGGSPGGGRRQPPTKGRGHGAAPASGRGRNPHLMMAGADKTRTQPNEKGWWSGERREAAQRIHQGVNRTEARGRHPVKTGGSQRRPTDPQPFGKIIRKKGQLQS